MIPHPGAVLRAMRPKQWTKNVVVLAALLFAMGDPSQGVSAASLGAALLALLAFCLVSSGVYVLNDLRDVELDRQHPVKCLRPIAAGELPVAAARIMIVLLLASGLLLAHLVQPHLFSVVSVYLVMQVLYTYALKKMALVDLFVIAGGFVLRALAGAVAIAVDISPWLLLCTLLLALFLALCKRRHELVVMQDAGGATRPSLQNYNEKLLDQLIAMMGAATLICYALYTLWPDTVHKFGTMRLGFTIPFVLFGLFRYMDLVYRKEMGGRPEQILLTDRPLLASLFLYALTAAWALFFR